MPTLYFYKCKILKIKLYKPSVQGCSYLQTLHKDLISYLLKSVAKLLLVSMLSFTAQTVKEATFICVLKCETAFRFLG